MERATDAHGSESELTEAVIGSAFEVANVLGAGFLALLVNFQRPKVEWKRVLLD
ncbi:MAG: hypothetical protein KJZ78_26690 [Bryobacteraceae bacterium]|nr:hypothetical protein [Bryobacteraceae bacterium]